MREGNFNFDSKLGSENRLDLFLGRLLFYLRTECARRVSQCIERIERVSTATVTDDDGGDDW